MKFSPLVIRLFTAHLLLFAAATLATSAASAWRVDQNLTNQYEARGRAIASNIASASAEFLQLHDVSAIQAMIDQTLELEGASYVFVSDADGKIVAHTFAAGVPDELATLNNSASEIVSRSIHVPGRPEFMDISAPIQAGRSGFVHVGMDPAAIRAAVWSAIGTQLALLGIIFVVSLVIGVWLVTRIIDPLDRLTNYANTMAGRDFTAVQPNLLLDEAIVPIARRSDEVGQLAKSFQHMVREVSGRERQLRQARDELELRVEERTAAAEQRTFELIRVNAELEREIAERKRAVAALRKSAEEIFDLYNNAPCGYHSVDINGTVLRMNDTELNWLGYTREEVLGEMKIADFVSRDSLPAFQKTLAGFLRVGKVNEFEFDMLRKDGTTLAVLLNSTALNDTTGNFVMSRSTVFDITERKRAEEEIKVNERRLNAVMDSAEVGCWELDLANDRAWRSLRHDQLFGYDSLQPEWGYKIFLAHVVPADLDMVQQTYAGALVSGNIQLECRVQWRDGSVHWLAANGRVHRDDQGTPIRMMGVVMNIDARKKMEEKLALQTAELARSNQELVLFASVASHDLQEPLRMVASYMELLSQRYRGKLDEKADRWIGFAVSGVVRMKQLINDLLEFSRVGTRGKPFVPTDCAAIVHTVTQNLHQAIQDSSATVICTELPTVRADASQLTQVFQNLIANAIKFRGSQAPEVHVEAEREEDQWRFAVRDNGIGIDSQFAERIFVIFQRLHSHEEYPGTGIGLALCRKVIERHGGRIWVDSQPGKGATFFFTIPDAAPKAQIEAM